MSTGFLCRLAGLVAFVFLPFAVLLTFKWPISADILFYSTAIKHFSAQLWSGDIYPRWLNNLNGEFGSPALFFYGPLPYYLGSFFEWLSPIDPYGFVRFLLVMVIILFLAGITSYRWLRIFFSTEQAEKGALLYVGFPYLFVLLYTIFGLTQLCAYALMPFLLEASHDVTQKGKRA